MFIHLDNAKIKRKNYTRRKSENRKRRIMHISKTKFENAVYTRRKHKNRKRRFIRVENTKIEKVGLWTKGA